VGTAFAQSTAPTGGPPALVGIFPIVAVLAVFYLIVIRPEQKKRKEHEALVKNLKRNDQVLMVSGIYGKVVNVGEKTLSVQIAPNVQVQVDPSAIQTVQRGAGAEKT
jgi:preprotein translocase subunit YajC